jgi:sulfite dehydrogenase (cytochrome) subunit B
MRETGMNSIRLIVASAALAAFAIPVAAEEQFIELRDAPGKDVVEQSCGGCHSLDYVRMNAPFMKPETWDAEVTKMIKAFGAPISDGDAKTIREYLVKNYGG